MITGEFPPQPGGVSDYARLVAMGLAAAGDEVCVWAPRCARGEIDHGAVTVRRLPSRFGPRSLAILDRGLKRRAGRVLVQYVPHAYGLKAMNILFCLWLYLRRGPEIDVMFHEVMFPARLRQPLRHNALAGATWMMAALAARSAARIFVSTPAWEALLRGRVRIASPIAWLPIPSCVPVIGDPAGIRSFRRRHAADGDPVIGHLGTYGGRIAQSLDGILPELLDREPKLKVLLAGIGSGGFRADFATRHPGLADRVHATGELPAADLSLALAGCDVMMQPFPDGVSTRRTSVMAALAHGVPVVANSGFATEPLWAESGAVALAPDNDCAAMGRLAAQLLADPATRADYSAKARELYARRFDLKHTIAALRSN